MGIDNVQIYEHINGPTPTFQSSTYQYQVAIAGIATAA